MVGYLAPHLRLHPCQSMEIKVFIRSDKTYKMTSNNKFFFYGSLFGLIAIILGAFGTHTLSEMITGKQMISFQTGLRYQFYHAFALLILGLMQQQNPKVNYNRIANFFIIGTILFAGSIYLLATRDITHLPGKFLGPITPIGGLVLIIGWVMLLMKSIRTKV